MRAASVACGRELRVRSASRLRFTLLWPTAALESLDASEPEAGDRCAASCHRTVHARVNIALSEAVPMGAAVGARAVGCGKRRAWSIWLGTPPRLSALMPPLSSVLAGAFIGARRLLLKPMISSFRGCLGLLDFGAREQLCLHTFRVRRPRALTSTRGWASAHRMCCENGVASARSRSVPSRNDSRSIGIACDLLRHNTMHSAQRAVHRESSEQLQVPAP